MKIERLEVKHGSLCSAIEHLIDKRKNNKEKNNGTR